MNGPETGAQQPEAGATPDPGAPPIPRDYRMAVPTGWHRVVLDPQFWDRQIAKVVDTQTAGRDDLPLVKARLTELIREQAQAAYDNGGVAMYLSTMRIGDVPLSASAIITYVPALGRILPALDQLAINYAAAGHEATMVELPAAGLALRRRYREELVSDPKDGKGVRTLVTTVVEYRLNIPDTPNQVVVTFSTPVEPIADVMAELFDTIVGTFGWTF
ncbi:hypothetical protein KGQ20_18585 [Catenulispora sp. NF23]|uniref:Lipoprotein n=1 Tax=Catenulispora pinistramenti TaxID=2705254 RepID=A0ABS5KZ83_9ACTN|nr:hypothetical protein [Catenulispora pinistramenti]MBS2534781.1 hypothetical protein [Catenulispora pinistramenti]MBS2551392.1 hypothetical protein [Catenulispora pinistramenti]